MRDSGLLLPGQQKVAAPADVVLSRLKLEPNEYLLVKIPAGLPPPAVEHVMRTLPAQLAGCLGENAKRALIYFEGSLEFTKITIEEAAKGPPPPPAP